MDKLNNEVHTAMGGRYEDGSAAKKIVQHFLLKGRRSKSTGDSSHNSRNVKFVNLPLCALPED